MPPKDRTDPPPAAGDAARVAELERENAELRRQVAEQARTGGLFTTDAARKPYFNEAMREELAAQGWTVDPTTGAKITEDPRG